MVPKTPQGYKFLRTGADSVTYPGPLLDTDAANKAELFLRHHFQLGSTPFLLQPLSDDRNETFGSEESVTTLVAGLPAGSYLIAVSARREVRGPLTKRGVVHPGHQQGRSSASLIVSYTVALSCAEERELEVQLDLDLDVGPLFFLQKGKQVSYWQKEVQVPHLRFCCC